MKDVLRDLAAMDGVMAVLFFSEDGDLLFKEMLLPPVEDPEKKEWWPLLIHSLAGIREMELVFDRGRVYIRKTGRGYLLIFMSRGAPVALLRLHCDTVLPALDKTRQVGRGLGRWLRWNRGKGRIH